jgi:hypothetical protein
MRLPSLWAPAPNHVLTTQPRNRLCRRFPFGSPDSDQRVFLKSERAIRSDRCVLKGGAPTRGKRGGARSNSTDWTARHHSLTERTQTSPHGNRREPGVRRRLSKRGPRQPNGSRGLLRRNLQVFRTATVRRFARGRDDRKGDEDSAVLPDPLHARRVREWAVLGSNQAPPLGTPMDRGGQCGRIAVQYRRCGRSASDRSGHAGLLIRAECGRNVDGRPHSAAHRGRYTHSSAREPTDR